MFSIGKLTSGVCDILNKDEIFKKKIISFVEDEYGNENAPNLSNIELLKIIFNHKDGKKYNEEQCKITIAYIFNRIGEKHCVFVREGEAHPNVKEEVFIFMIHKNGYIRHFKNASDVCIQSNIKSPLPSMSNNSSIATTHQFSSVPPVGTISTGGNQFTSAPPASVPPVDTISTGENQLNMNSTMNSYSTFIPPSANTLIRTDDFGFSPPASSYNANANASASTSFNTNIGSDVHSNFFDNDDTQNSLYDDIFSTNVTVANVQQNDGLIENCDLEKVNTHSSNIPTNIQSGQNKRMFPTTQLSSSSNEIDPPRKTSKITESPSLEDLTEGLGCANSNQEYDDIKMQDIKSLSTHDHIGQKMSEKFDSHFMKSVNQWNDKIVKAQIHQYKLHVQNIRTQETNLQKTQQLARSIEENIKKQRTFYERSYEEEQRKHATITSDQAETSKQLDLFRQKIDPIIESSSPKEIIEKMVVLPRPKGRPNVTKPKN